MSQARLQARAVAVAQEALWVRQIQKDPEPLTKKVCS